MRITLFSLICLSLFAPTAFADTVSLQNGDKITGTIEEVSPTAVVVQTAYAGRLTISREAIKTLQSEKAVTVTRANNEKQQLFVSPNESGAGWQETVAAVPPPPPAPAGPPRFSNLLGFSPYWKNQLGIGVVNTTGNDESTAFNGNLTMQYERKPDEFTFKIDGVYALSNGAQTAGLLAENAIFRRDLNEKWFMYLSEDGRYDAIKGISLQATAGGGLGYWLIRNDKLKLDVRGGPAVTYLKTFDGNEDFSPAGEAGFRLAYVFNEWMSASHETTYTTSFTDLDIWRIHSETALKVKLDRERGIGLKLGLNDDYENKPAAGRKNNDTRTMLSVTVDF